MANDQDHIIIGAMPTGPQHNMTNPTPPATAADEDIVADLDEPPERQSRPAPLQLKTPVASFTKSTPRCDRQQSLLTSALHANSNASSPVEEQPEKSPARGMSTVSTWSNNSVTTADLTSDGGFTSPVSRASTPSPPPPSSAFHTMIPMFNKKPFDQPVKVVNHGDENIGPLQKVPAQPANEQSVEAVLGRKRCIMFACGNKEEKKPAEAPKPKPAPAPAPAPAQTEEPPKRVCTIKFACPAKVSTEPPKPRTRMVSPAPIGRRIPASPKPKAHRDSDSTVRNNSPVSVRKVPSADRPRRMSLNADLARCEAYRFHEFASSEEEIDEWTQESTCHRNRLTVSDTLKVENGLRQLGEEVEEEALDEDEDDDDAGGLNDDDDDELLEDDDEDDSDARSESTDEGFQTDDENGFAVSDDESDAGSDYNWWAPGASTAATSLEHIEQLRLKTTRTASESSIASLESVKAFPFPEKTSKRKKSKPMNIRVPSPELPDSTDFVCGTLDEDRPLEEAYMSTLERRRAAKHKPTPQDIDPTFPTSDPEMPDDEEDEVSEAEHVSESDNHFMLHGRMDPVDGDARGRRMDGGKKRSPLPSPPKRLRSPPPAKRAVHRSPPPRKLFGNSPRRMHSPPPPLRLRSPPPTRRGSVNPLAARQRTEMAIRFGGIGERPAPFVSASVPRTPITAGPNPLEYDEEDVGSNDMPVRRAIDIQVGLEKKRQRRKEQLYRKQHRKAAAKEKRPPPPGRGAERMREMGLAAHAHKGKTNAFNPFQVPATPDQKDMHVLSV